MYGKFKVSTGKYKGLLGKYLGFEVNLEPLINKTKDQLPKSQKWDVVTQAAIPKLVAHIFALWTLIKAQLYN